MTRSVRTFGNDSVRGLANSPQNVRQPPRYGVQADDRQIFDGEWAGNAGGSHGATANAGKVERTGWAALSARIKAAPNASPDSSAATK